MYNDALAQAIEQAIFRMDVKMREQGGAHLAGTSLPAMIRQVRKAIEAPLVIGGGIRTVAQAQQAWTAGADVVVVGNAFEEEPHLVYDMCRAAQQASKHGSDVR